MQKKKSRVHVRAARQQPKRGDPTVDPKWQVQCLVMLQCHFVWQAWAGDVSVQAESIVLVQCRFGRQNLW